MSVGASVLERKYPSFAIGAVSAVLIRGDEILLVKRNYPPGKGKWSLPGGVIEAGEKITEAAKRELYEETGLIAEPVGILWVLNNIVYDALSKVQYHYLIIDILFDDKTIKGELRPGGDVSEAKWFRLDQLYSVPDISRTVLVLIDKIRDHGLTTLPIDMIDHVSYESSRM